MAKRLAFLDNWTSVFLTAVERGGNALPHPATLFAILAGVVIVLSGIAATTNLEVVHPGTGEIIQPVSLLTAPGLHRILVEMVTNFTNFAPLGTVLVSMLGIGVMEASGLISAALRLLVLSAPKRLLTFVIVLSGVLSNTASEIGYVLLVPLGGIIFLGAGRHPIAGLAAAFAGVSGGYSANLLLGTIDPLLAGLSEEAAQIVQPGYRVNPTANYYFMVVSTLVISAAGTWVTERIVVPRLGSYEGKEPQTDIDTLSNNERRGLRFAAGAMAFFGAALATEVELLPQVIVKHAVDGRVCLGVPIGNDAYVKAEVGRQVQGHDRRLKAIVAFADWEGSSERTMGHRRKGTVSLQLALHFLRYSAASNWVCQASLGRPFFFSQIRMG